MTASADAGVTIKCPGCFQPVVGRPPRCPTCGESLAAVLPRAGDAPPAGTGSVAETTAPPLKQPPSSGSAASLHGAPKTEPPQPPHAHTPPPRAVGGERAAALIEAIFRTLDFKTRLSQRQYAHVFIVAAWTWAIGLPLLRAITGDFDTAGKILTFVTFPILSASVRRLHDTGESGKLLWLVLTLVGIPWVGSKLFAPGQADPNRFGPAPVR